MWNFASTCIAGNIRSKSNLVKSTHVNSECSDDEPEPSPGCKEECLECPICYESFNIVENIPYVLWCGHTLCKNCILRLQWAVVKFPTLPLQLPLFISCPWCNLLSLRLVYKGNLQFPRKNYILLWMVETMNGQNNRPKDPSTICETLLLSNSCDGEKGKTIPCAEASGSNNLLERIKCSFRKFLNFFIHLTAKFPFIIIFLLILLYAIPASTVILALYTLITLLFAIPSFLVLYFAYPSLDWLVREIAA
ncbi:hypothetical protein ACFE04_004231 [Oxalis oulophora]